MSAPARIAEVLRARQQISEVICYLRGGRDDELHLIEPDLHFEMGAIHALDWILGLPGGEWFVRHLEGLKSIEGDLRRATPEAVMLANKVDDIDRCVECNGLLPGSPVGYPPPALGKVCKDCILHRYHMVALEREREAWAGPAKKRLMRSLEKGKIAHLVLMNDPNLTYCGHKPTESRRHRMEIKPIDMTTAALCVKCRAALDRVLPKET